MNKESYREFYQTLRNIYEVESKKYWWRDKNISKISNPIAFGALGLTAPSIFGSYSNSEPFIDRLEHMLEYGANFWYKFVDVATSPIVHKLAAYYGHKIANNEGFNLADYLIGMLALEKIEYYMEIAKHNLKEYWMEYGVIFLSIGIMKTAIDVFAPFVLSKILPFKEKKIDLEELKRSKKEYEAIRNLALAHAFLTYERWVEKGIYWKILKQWFGWHAQKIIGSFTPEEMNEYNLRREIYLEVLKEMDKKEVNRVEEYFSPFYVRLKKQELQFAYLSHRSRYPLTEFQEKQDDNNTIESEESS